MCTSVLCTLINPIVILSLKACAYSLLALDLKISKVMTSIESARTRAYSPDIGWWIVATLWDGINIQGDSYQGVGTAHRIYTRFVNTGDVASLQRCSRPNLRRLDDKHELFIIALICENPTLYLHLREICSKISEVTSVIVSSSTVCRILHKYGCSRKKLTKIGKQRSTLYRGDFMAYVLQYPRDFFVWTDETGTDNRDQLRKLILGIH